MEKSLNMIAAALILSASVLAKPAPGPDDDKAAPAPSAPNVSHSKAMSLAIYQSINSSKMNLMIENHVQVPLHVRLLSEKNEVLHSEKVGKRLKNYWRKFDMAGMKDGEYTFEVSDGYNKITKTFRLETPKPEIQQPTRILSLL